jgi:O-antigen/teichoic acid export membrane protein
MKNNIIISILTIMIPMIFQLFFIRYVSYYVDENIYGTYIILQLIIIMISLLFTQVPLQAFDRFYNTTTNKSVFLNEFKAIQFFIGFISLPIIFFYVLSFKEYGLVIAIILYIYYVLFNSFAFNQKFFLLSLDRVNYLKLKLIEASSKFLMPLVFYFFYPSLESFLLGMLFGYLILLFMTYKKNKFITTYKINFDLDIAKLKMYFHYAYPMLFISIFAFGISFLDRYFIENFLGLVEVARFSLISQVAAMAQVIGQIYILYVTPILLKAYEEDVKNAMHMFDKYILYLLFVLFIMFIVIYFLPIGVYSLVLKENMIGDPSYHKVFIVVAFSSIMFVVQTALIMFFQLKNKLMYASIFYLAGFIVSFCVNLYIEDFGIIAAAASKVAAYSTIVFLMVFYIIKIRKDENHGNKNIK